MQLTYRTSKAINAIDTSAYEPLPGFEPPEASVRTISYSPDGRFFAFADLSSVSILDHDGRKFLTIPQANVLEVAFSPGGSFVITWERPGKSEDGNTMPNLHVWNTHDGSHVIAFVQKSQTGWNLQYTLDEKICARLVANEIQFYEIRDMCKVWQRLRVEGATDFKLSPGQGHSVAVFIPEKKGAPASVRVFNVPSFSQPVSQKTFYKADKVQFKWNKLGTNLLVLTQTEVDKTGKSYYGETNLYLLGIAGNYDSRIALDKEGPIHDVTWSPNAREFGVVYGYMPSKTVLFDQRGKVAHVLPSGPRNMILFSPHGRFIAVAGFGNLQGQMDIFDRDRDFAKLSTIEASNASVCEWSPDGRMVMTATTSPRLRVDNGIKVWHFLGTLIYQQDMHELYEVHWRPEPADSYPLRSLSPPPPPHSSASTAPKAAARVQGAYRPPHARNAPATTLASLEQASVNGSSGFNGSRQPRLPPGALLEDDESGGLTRTAMKNKKKRESAKKHHMEETDGDAPPAAAAAAVENGTSHQTNGTGATDVKPEDKKTRALLKKLRAIEELKMRLANDEKLEDTQIKKINTEDAVRKELTALGWEG